MIVIDATGKAVFINAAAEAVFGVKAEDVLGRTPREALANPIIAEAFERALDKSSSAIELSLGEPPLRCGFLQTTPILSDEQCIGAVAVVQELTELRQAEARQREFIANVSHELRTPVTNIRAMGETLLAGAKNTDRAEHFISNTVREAERLSSLVADLLDLASLEAAPRSERERVSLAKVAHVAREHVRVKSEDRGVRVEIDIVPELDVMVEAKRVEQVFVNLLQNAINSMRYGGRVTVSASKQEHAVEVAVEDTGIGIPRADLPRIFERFYRVDKARSREGGTGIGLAIVKHIVESHGGIHVESELRNFVASCRELPLSEAAEATPALVAHEFAADRGGGPRKEVRESGLGINADSGCFDVGVRLLCVEKTGKSE